MVLPFQPEPVEALQNRFRGAIGYLWDLTVDTILDAPGNHRRHVFDYEDGHRIIVSVDKITEASMTLAGIEAQVCLHFSISTQSGVRVAVCDADKRIIELSQIKWPVKYHYLHSSRVLHLFVPLPNFRLPAEPGEVDHVRRRTGL